MKRILALALAMLILLALCACGEQETDTPTTNPTTTSPTTTNPTTKPVGMSEDEAKQIASKLLGDYIWYGAVGACCEMEYVEGDMSAYLSDAQKDIYVGSQQRITCCKNEEEVIAHLHQTFSDRLITSYPEDLLFTDDDGNLYIIIYPTGLPYYKDHRLISYNESFIVLEADCYEEDQREGTARITCARTFDGFILEEFEYISATTTPTTMTEEEAKQIAIELMGRYNHFASVYVCCDSEYAEGDMSAYLTDAQKDTYIGHQHKILCCKSVAEVNEHIRKTLDISIFDEDVTDLLFSDDEGNMYVIIYPSEYTSFEEYRVVYFDDDTIILEGDNFEEGELDGIGRLICVRTETGFVVQEFHYIPEH